MVRTSDTVQTDSSLMVRSLAAWETAVAALREQLQVAQAATLAEQARALAAESRADMAEQGREAEHHRAEELRAEVERLRGAHERAVHAADTMTQAETARQGRGPLARLRAALSGE